jgi:hypothetical protein
MPHRHAQRKGQVIQPSDKCLRRWRRLIKRAGGPGFVEAACDAGRHAVAPLGYRDADSPFMRLVRMGKDWASLSRDGRAGCVAQAQALAARCAEILDAGDDEGPGERKDIYG